MRYLNNYSTYIKEKLHISNVCEELQEIISNDLDIVLSEYDNSLLSTNKIYKFDRSDLKLDNLEVTFNLYPYKSNICNAKTLPKYKTDNIEAELIFDIYIEDINQIFKIDINSVILHECLHLLQSYNIFIKNKFRTSSWSIGSIISQVRNIYKTDFMKNLIELIYLSLDHEVAANIHQYYFYKKNGLDYIKMSEIIIKLNEFKPVILNGIEENEFNNFKNHIYNSIKFNVNNKNYLNDLNKSIWLNKDNNVVLLELDKIFKNTIKKIELKTNKIDNNIKKYENSTIETEFLNVEFLYLNSYNPFFLMSLFN